MTKEMIEDLLKAVTNMSNEVKDLQTSGSNLDELYTKIEIRVNDVGLGLSGLQQDIRNIDQRVTNVVEELSRMRIARSIVHKPVN